MFLPNFIRSRFRGYDSLMNKHAKIGGSDLFYLNQAIRLPLSSVYDLIYVFFGRERYTWRIKTITNGPQRKKCRRYDVIFPRTSKVSGPMMPGCVIPSPDRIMSTLRTRSKYCTILLTLYDFILHP